MPLPWLLSAFFVAKKTSDIFENRERREIAKTTNDENVQRLYDTYNRTNECLDELSRYEVSVLASFSLFSGYIEKFQNRPVFEELAKNRLQMPDLDLSKIRSLSIDAKNFMDGVVGLNPLKTLGEIGTISFLAGLSGSPFLSLGFLLTGFFSDNKDTKEIEKQVRNNAYKINKICGTLSEIQVAARCLKGELERMIIFYERQFKVCDSLLDKYKVRHLEKINIGLWSHEDVTCIENLTLIVGLLYKMCKIQIVTQQKDTYKVHQSEIDQVSTKADDFVKNL